MTTITQAVFLRYFCFTRTSNVKSLTFIVMNNGASSTRNRIP